MLAFYMGLTGWMLLFQVTLGLRATLQVLTMRPVSVATGHEGPSSTPPCTRASPEKGLAGAGTGQARPAFTALTPECTQHADAMPDAA
jgi:hypothetical protein